MSGDNGGTAKKLTKNQRAFLAAVRTTGNITAAARAAPIDRCQHYRWLAQPRYAEAFEAAMDEACDLLEEEARKRAIEGVPEPVFYQGQAVGAVRKYSDQLLMFLLNGHRPERFKYRHYVRHSGTVGFTLDTALSQLRKRQEALLG